MPNFSFLHPEWPDLHTDAARAEAYLQNDPRTAVFYARRALEKWVNWLYDHDPAFQRPLDPKLYSLLVAPSYKAQVPPQIQDKADFIRQRGNTAVHREGTVSSRESLAVVRELWQITYWLARTYTRGNPKALPTAFDERKLPPSAEKVKQLTAGQLQELDTRLQDKEHELAEQRKAAAGYQAQIEYLQAQVAAAKAANEKVAVEHDYTEADTRTLIIDLMLREAGWDPAGKNVAEYEVKGMPNPKGVGFVDYVLWGADGLPLALVEAKRTTKNPDAGKQQAKLYADCLEELHGQRPIIFYTRGYTTWMWDDENYPPRLVQGYYTRGELQLLIQRRKSVVPLADVPINKNIVNRYYQEEAIRAVCHRFESKHRRGLLVMATGTGKTRVAIALVDLLMRANWVKRALFLADRTALVRQAVNAFKRHLPEANPINLLEDRQAQESRVVVSTYHTMMGMIDELDSKGQKRLGVGHFDLVIIDEAHRSVYQKFGAIFDYFDSLLVGLTATPKDDVDKNTYHLFRLPDGVPTFNYDLSQAVADQFLVPPRGMSVALKFPHEGIRYDELSEEDKAEWDMIEWDEDGEAPDFISSAAINAWLFNENTVDIVLETLMSRGLKVKGGDRLGKTIIFARNHDHAEFIVSRFDASYPHQVGKFCRVIDNYVNYAQSLIDDFSKVDDHPHIAVSVDMLDTGIDVPEVVNLVFFKPVRSRTKFFQMIGRGTRLCLDLFARGEDKTEFLIFDVCMNFEYFNENPQGVEAKTQEPLTQRIFKSRLQLLEKFRAIEPQDDGSAALEGALLDDLHKTVTGIPLDNFIVRPRREYVEKFANRDRWNGLTMSDFADLEQHVSGLPTASQEEDENALRFDLLVLTTQLALLQGAKYFPGLQKRIQDIARNLEAKANIPMIHAHLPLLQDVQTDEYWEGITLQLLEELRIRVRDLIKFLDKRDRKPVYSDFIDEFHGITEVKKGFFSESGINIPMYRAQVEQFVRAHQDQQVIRKIRLAMPLTAQDLKQLEEFFFAADETGTREEFEQAYGELENLGIFIRGLVGLDRKAAKEAFSLYLEEKNLSLDQIRFIDYIINHYTVNGTMRIDLLYEPPYTDLHHAGLDGLFPGKLGDLVVTILKKLNQVIAPTT